jgi:hypothetical protein
MNNGKEYGYFYLTCKNDAPSRLPSSLSMQTIISLIRDKELLCHKMREDGKTSPTSAQECGSRQKKPTWKSPPRLGSHDNSSDHHNNGWSRKMAKKLREWPLPLP